MSVRHPYLEASHEGLTPTDTLPVKNIDTAETLVEGIVEDVTDSDSEGAGRKHPQNKRQGNECEAPCDFNSAMVTYQLGNRTRLPVHKNLGTQPQEGGNKEVTVEIDLDRRMPETQVKTGAAGDTLSILVD